MAQESPPSSVTTVSVPATPAQQIIVQQPPSAFGRFGKWLFFALVIAIMACISLYSSYHSYFSPSDLPREKYHSLAKYATKKIAIIAVDGTIYGGEDSFAKKQIDRVRDDPEVVAVVLRVDSPGGSVTGSDYIYHHLRQLVETRDLPLVVSMGSICASGGYYVSMAVGDRPDTIYAEPTTWTGSIGVIIPHFDVSGSLDALRIKEDSVASAPLKTMASPTRPMSDKEREILQTLVNDTFKGFKDIVKAGRPKFQKDEAGLDAVATGQIFTAKQAQDHGLVDRIGFIEEAIGRAAELAGVSDDDVRCVKYEKQPTLLGEFVGVTTNVPGALGFDPAALVELSAPKAYYLWSWPSAVMMKSQ